MSITILGLDVNDYNTSAALLLDGKIVAAVQEERLNRERRTRRFPLKSIEFCLKAGRMSLKDIDIIAVSVNPSIYLESLNLAQSERARYRGEILYGVPNYILGLKDGINALSSTLDILVQGEGTVRFHYVTHHDAHAAASYYTSPFNEAAVLSMDGFGEKETTVYFRGEDVRVERIKSVYFPHSIGCFYAVMTEFLGLRPFNEEWKLMAAAAYGDHDVYLKKLRDLISYEGEGDFELNLPFFNHYQFHRSGGFTKKLEVLLGPAFRKGEGFTKRFFDIAAAVQRVTEEIVFELIQYLHKKFPSKNLCLSGGVAMNSVLNGKVHDRTPFEDIYIPPMPDDSGSSLGAALHTYYYLCNGKERNQMIHNYLGPSFSDDEVREELQRYNIRFQYLESPPKTAAKLIEGGKILGWFQGGMEFGDRALGNRSILADPRSSRMKDIINQRVKMRDKFQPFAPSVLDRHKDDFFVTPKFSPFMERVAFVREEKNEVIPAVVHQDKSARLQTLSKEQNPIFHELILEFMHLTGIPLVINTSLNVSGEPIVCTPGDAVRTFYSSGLDALIINCFLIEK